MPRFLVVTETAAGFFIQSGQQIEGDVRRLVVRGIGPGDVGAKRAQCCLARERPDRLTGDELHCVTAGQQTGGDGFGITFDARDLSGEEYMRLGSELQRRRQQCRCVDVGIAVDLAEAQELGIGHAGDHAQDAGLFGVLQVVLEADHVEAVRAGVLLPELDCRVGPSSGTRVG